LQEYFQNLKIESKEQVQVRKLKKSRASSRSKKDPTELIINRFIKKTKNKETSYELVNDSLKKTVELSHNSQKSKPLTLRETLSRRKQLEKGNSYESDIIKDLKQNIMMKSSLYGSKNSSIIKSKKSGSRKILKDGNFNNHSVFRFNKFENEQRSKIYF
jgi:hypothetical protein